nr:hypothetical protein BaRGS_012537 [Batillaria attramentaria]
MPRQQQVKSNPTRTASYVCKGRHGEESSGIVVPDTSLFQEESVIMYNDLADECDLDLKEVYKLKQTWRTVKRRMKFCGVEMFVR